jgi:hypothetical protein
MSNCNHDVIAWRDENGKAHLWGCYQCRVKFVPITQLVDEVLLERELCAKVCDEASDKALALQSGRQDDLGSIILRHHAVAHQSDAAAIRARNQE